MMSSKLLHRFSYLDMVITEKWDLSLSVKIWGYVLLKADGKVFASMQCGFEFVYLSLNYLYAVFYIHASVQNWIFT